MKHIFLPSHLDSGNRGCEAITKGTKQIVNDEYSVIACSQDIRLDNQLGYENVKLVRLQNLMGFSEDSSRLVKLRARVVRRLYRQDFFRELYYKYRYKETFFQYKKGDVALSTGGDMFCYIDDFETINLVDYLHKDGIPTILWGCSIGEENLTPRKMEVLKKFSAITVRESLTESVLKEKLGLEHVYRFPDPAFVLEPEQWELPNYFNHDVIGINLSNFVGANVDFDTMVGQNLVVLFDDILSNTDMEIVLFPHVFWKGQDDRIVCNAFYEHYRATERVHLLDTESKNYCQIRYAISKCRFFIGARTHAMISAYSTCVPALALGYSIKSIGIAKDLGLPKELVVDYRTLASENAFSNAFTYALEHESAIREHLQTIMPEYIQKTYEMKKVLEMV